MKIIMSPAKEMGTDVPVQKDGSSTNSVGGSNLTPN